MSRLGGRVRIPRKPPTLDDLLEKIHPDRFGSIFAAKHGPAPEGKYRHWNTLCYLEPPAGLSHEEWWLGIKLVRNNMAHPLPLRDTAGSPFTYSMPDAAQERVHKIDQLASGQIAVSEAVTNPATRDRYLVSSLIEEAITSSQLEGASTSRRVARNMIRSGRPPRDTSERMILNNYRAMNRVRVLSQEKLTPELIYELHRIVTDGTLDEPDAAGRPQLPHEERVKVYWERGDSGKILHTPPPAEELPERIEALCRFANGEEPEWFLHPVVRAIVVHFWLAYDHPFLDGNGRTARALFYWSMLKQGYWLAEFLTISNILKKAPAKYTRSFLFTETDDGDTTYFILYNLEVVMRAIEELNDYLRRKVTEVKEVESLIKGQPHFNHRQLALFGHALRNPDASYTVISHSSSHDISSERARLDLLDLEKQSLLLKRKIGKANHYFPPNDLPDRLRDVNTVATR